MNLYLVSFENHLRELAISDYLVLGVQLAKATSSGNYFVMHPSFSHHLLNSSKSTTLNLSTHPRLIVKVLVISNTLEKGHELSFV